MIAKRKVNDLIIDRAVSIGAPCSSTVDIPGYIFAPCQYSDLDDDLRHLPLLLGAGRAHALAVTGCICQGGEAARRTYHARCRGVVVEVRPARYTAGAATTFSAAKAKEMLTGSDFSSLKFERPPKRILACGAKRRNDQAHQRCSSQAKEQRPDAHGPNCQPSGQAKPAHSW